MSVTKLTCPACEAVLKSGAAIAAGAKIKCPKCGSGFTYQQEEVAEYDDYAERADDDVEEEEHVVTRPRKAKKKKKQHDRGRMVLAVSIGAVVLLVAGGGYAAYRFLRTPDFEEPLAFVAPDTAIVLGMDIERLADQFSLQSQVEPALAQEIDGFSAAKCRETTGLESVELFNQVYASFNRGAAGVGGIFVIKSKKPFSPAKVEKLLNLKNSKKIGGRACFTTKLFGQSAQVFIPSSRLMVAAFNVPERNFAEIVAADGTKIAVPSRVMEMIEPIRSNELWAVLPATNEMKQNMAQAATMPDNKDSAAALALMQNASGFGAWLTLGSGQVKLTAGVHCPDAANAANVNSELQKQRDNQTKGFGAAAKMTIGLAMLPKPTQEVVRELMQNMRFSIQGTMALLSTQTTVQGAKSAIEGFMQIGMGMARQQGFGPG